MLRRTLDVKHIKSISKGVRSAHDLSPETIALCLSLLTEARDKPNLYWKEFDEEALSLIRLAIKELTFPM